MSQNPIRFTVLGPVRAFSGDRELNLGPRQQRQVLGLLLIRAGRDIPVHQFAEMLWGHAAPASAVNSLHRFIGALRRILEPDLPARSQGRWLLRRDASYRLVAPQGAIDLMEFRRLADEAREAESMGLRDVAVARYAEALRRSSGRCADDGAGDAHRYAVFLSIDAEYATVARDAARAAVTFDRLGDLLPAVRRAAEMNPLDESLQARLMLMLAADGRQADAFALFQSVRDALARELGVDPGAELRAAYDEVLHPRPLAVPSPARIERVSPAQLPRDLPLFTGRRADLDRVSALHRAGERDGGMPIVAIDGMPGAGKSTFAVHWAHEVAAHFPDGQIYLDLRGEDPGAALTALLSTLGVPEAAVPSSLNAKAALYRSHLAGRRMLVLLDNAESAEQARPLLPGAAGCLTVVTSRRRLTALAAAEGAHLVTLGLPDAAEARQLLTRRLAATLGDRALPAREVLDAIVGACGRLPAALTAVATESGGRLDGLDALGGLRTAFAGSYEALPEPAARLFRLLSLHPGPDLTPAAAASLIGRPERETAPLLARLTGEHLLGAAPSQRLTMHVLLKAYAQELVNEHDEPDAARARLFGHYRHTAYEANRLLRPLLKPLDPGVRPEGVTVEEFGDYCEAFQWFRAEHRVLRALIERSDGPGVWQLATTMVPFYQWTGRRHEWLATMRAALASAERGADRLGEAHMQRCLAGAFHALGDRDEARDRLTGALRLFTELGALAEQAHVHLNLGLVRPPGEASFTKAFELYERAGYDRGTVAATEGLALSHAAQGRDRPAIDLYERAMAGYLRLGDPRGVGSCLLGLGRLRHRRGERAVAADLLRRSVELYREAGHRGEEAEALIALGDALTGRDALPAWRAALEILAELRLPAVREVQSRLHSGR
ncbi:AfsR/SARP family transcriptional regulator [Paractinoplanes atraurantiacus]|uniref:DNA-binding transcriptional activator of the SARP family n=1 Tax=Paractinoplanes atraurantiacus TaxID=1036182 RepID=A0A285JWC9_9ACTN|nr:BTAD domain-containing putative transcriptional regulator [Actinoplanes atraurantiacus]SNY64639.1 DNA-binding transcriptional activator of the SARP family [Actinoplanes atraurantiacus]